MELRQLRYFVTTADTLSFSAAARKLFISQSTLSQQIRQLEGELGTELLARDSHKVALTEAGDRLLPLARKTIEDADICRTQILDLKETVSGDLIVGVTHSFSTVVSDVLKQFLVQYRNVTVNIIYANTHNLMEMLRSRKIDFAIAYQPHQEQEDMEVHEIFRDQLCAVVRKDHMLAERKKVSLKDLEGFGIAMPSRELQARCMLNRYLEETDANLRVRIQLNDANFLLDLIDDSAHLVGILSGETIRHHANMVAIPLDIPHNTMIGCVHVLKDAYVKRSAKLFVSMIRKRIADN
mgnify:CR=1 FL=1